MNKSYDMRKNKIVNIVQIGSSYFLELAKVLYI